MNATEIGADVVAPDTQTTDRGDDTLSEGDLIARLTQAPEEPEPADDTETQEDVGEAELPEDAQAEATEEAPEETEETGVDSVLDNLDESGWERLAEELKSSAADRIQGLVRRAKTAEERLADLQQTAQTQQEDPIAQATQDDGPNPFAEVETIEELAEQAKNLGEFATWAEDILDDHSNAHGDEVVWTQDGTDYTKREIRAKLREARAKRDRHLPARAQELRTAEQTKARAAQVDAALETRHPWMGKDDDPVRSDYEKLLTQPAVARAIGELPELKAVLAEGTEAFHSKGKVAPKKAEAPKQPQRKPIPTGPAGGAAEASKPSDNRGKMLSELKGRFETTGSPEDLAAYLQATNQ